MNPSKRLTLLAFALGAVLLGTGCRSMPTYQASDRGGDDNLIANPFTGQAQSPQSELNPLASYTNWR